MVTWINDILAVMLMLMAGYGGITLIQLRKKIDWNNEVHLLVAGMLGGISLIGLVLGILVLLGIMPTNHY